MLKDVKNVGKKDQIVDVSTGYASNYLFPRKLAVMYTDKSSQILDQQKADREAHEAQLKKQAEEQSSTCCLWWR